MGNSPFADALIQTLLGWLKWLTDIVWSLVQGGGETGVSLFRWFSNNWIALLIILLLAGLVIDWLIWMIRWRPYWLWFKKKRPVAQDKPVRRVAPVPAVSRVQPPRFTSSLKNEESFFAEMEDMSESAELFDEPAVRPVRHVPVAQENAADARYDTPSYDMGQKEKETTVAFSNDDEKYRRYMRPEPSASEEIAAERNAAEDAQPINQTEEARPLSRRERRMFFEGKDNEEDDV